MENTVHNNKLSNKDNKAKDIYHDRFTLSQPVDGGISFYEINDMMLMHSILDVYKEFPDAENVMGQYIEYIRYNYTEDIKRYDDEHLVKWKGTAKFELHHGNGLDKHFYISGPASNKAIVQFASVSDKVPGADVIAMDLWNKLTGY